MDRRRAPGRKRDVASCNLKISCHVILKTRNANTGADFSGKNRRNDCFEEGVKATLMSEMKAQSGHYDYLLMGWFEQ